ncbi:MULTISPECIES: hypothetical protein [Bacillus]|uniref:Uncharacterized protein n=2 Tax=Bacillus thuringiensis TaxID=1428 RepID=A0AAP4Q6L0_BACTU|nr:MULTISPECIES: hypothetical protein [Bacillus]MEC0045379.1 hypothetical protein [Bacillus cereus]AFV21377.1 hypothetical protein BTB_502p00410 [Bacillus thuringiensis Bt407]EEM25586.1 hypothetical protein bthur0002_62290 [Bacillus thuringiensis Bt407]ERI01447.1 hypothetical protein BTCBT_003035 [Bacillus thuringiensis T01-328]MBN6708168.1 hypothetical protein [Bacillus thuringiensis]
MVTLFHCSNRVFDEFKISKELAVHKEHILVEGYGIYMTKNYSVASSYGNVVYSVGIKEEDIIDCTSERELYDFLGKVGNEIGIDFSDYINIEDLIMYVLEGETSITKIYKEINLQLDSNESFYFDFEDKITYESDCIQRQIEDVVIKNLNSVIKYNDKSLGEVYICHKNPEVLEIVNVQEKKFVA